MKTADILIGAKVAKSTLSMISEEDKNKALLAMAESIRKSKNEILSANDKDMERAKGTLSQAMQDRLLLTEKRIDAMADSICELTKLPDPVGITLSETERPNGLKIKKVSVPMGVIGIIYEARPNVTSDAAALCFKSSSVSVLRSGKEAWNSADAIVTAMKKGLISCSLDHHYINLIEDTSRESAYEMMNAVGLIDLLIPRGGKGLISNCVANAKVPCIETGTGICHIYVDKSADIRKALDVIENAKTSRPSVCNACEVCLVDREIAGEFLPKLKDRLENCAHPVQLRFCPECLKYVEGEAAGDKDFDTEFLDYILAVKVISNVYDAVDHISRHSTHHSEAIIAEDRNAQEIFTKCIDSAALYINASTRFTDGGEFGLGCEMGISTQKLHARGPMGLSELTTYKYIIEGEGQIR